MTEKEVKLKELSAAQFAMWEMNMYLDTHPNDLNAMEMYSDYQDRADALKKLYEQKYGPLNIADAYSSQKNDWLKNPWPWELEANK